MAKNKFSLDFDGFLELAKQIDEMGEGYLKQAVDNALTQSKDYVNQEIEKAMDKSVYSFTAGKGRSKGRTRESLHKISRMPVEWNGTVAKAYIGVDLKEAPEAVILAYGSPHLAGDTRLKNALKVKGKVRKEVDNIQQKEFFKIIQEAQK